MIVCDSIKKKKLDSKLALTFDDLQILPRKSDIESRSTINTSVQFSKNFYIDAPLIASPMADVVELPMAKVLWELGGVGVIHRFMSVEDQCSAVEKLREHIVHNMNRETGYKSVSPLVCAAIGATDESYKRALALIDRGANCLLIDVAHGHSIHVERILNKLADFTASLPYSIDIIAGNLVTAEAAHDLELWGASALRVGIGNGSACSTRIQTGIGLPQATAIQEVAVATTLPIIADGGIRTSGDAAKALCLGANSVMCGSLFAGHAESPGEIISKNNKIYKKYRGSASADIKLLYNNTVNHVEGVSSMVEFKGSIGNTIASFMDGITSCASYLGVSRIDTMHDVAEFVQVTHAGIREAYPHILL